MRKEPVREKEVSDASKNWHLVNTQPIFVLNEVEMKPEICPLDCIMRKLLVTYTSHFNKEVDSEARFQ